MEECKEIMIISKSNAVLCLTKTAKISNLLHQLTSINCRKKNSTDSRNTKII